MCQPPEITLPGGASEALEAATSNDAWHSQSSDGWVSPSPRGTANNSWANEQASLGASGNQALFAKFGQFQQQHRAAQLAALSAATTPQTPAWSHGLGSNLAEKLQRAAAAASGAANKPHDATSLPWMARQAQAFTPAAPAPVPNPLWAAATPMLVQQPVGAPMMASMPHQLVAQGIPLGMQFAHLQEEEDDQDPKKFKRMMSNRASAKRSRQRRQERLDELEIVSAKLQVENATVQRRLNEAADRIRKFQQENDSLQQELRHLKSMMVAKGVTPSTTPDNTSPGTMTKQDSCGPNGSTTDQPSSQNPTGSSSPKLAAKRPRDEVAESRFQGEGGQLARRAKIESPVTPSSGTTSDDAAADGLQIVLGAAAGPHEDLLHHGIGVILDDDLLTTFMDECFEAKAIDATLAKQ